MQDNDINKEVESGEVNAEALNTEEIVQKKEKKNFKYLQGFLSGFCFFAFTFFVINLVFNVFDLKDGQNKEIEKIEISSENKALEKVETKLNIIKQYIDEYFYYDTKVDDEKVADNIYSSYLNALNDPYTVYYDKEAFSSMMESSSGTYYGIGCVVTLNPETKEVVVVEPYEGSPAYEAGLKVGDIILKADDMTLTGKDINEAVTYIKGKEGTKVKITYFRDGEEKEVSVERRKIDVPTIKAEMLPDNIGYVKIAVFDEITVEQFKDSVNDLKDKGAKGFIFDVRSNPGGLYSSVVEMLDMLLPEGTLVYTEDKYKNRETETSDASNIKLPMAVLINGDSASASEIFAGALQDFKWAKVIGTQSFGKGIVQNVIPLGDGTGIKFTISSYFTPSGDCIHDVGITPDEVVELPKDESAFNEAGILKRESDTQLNSAISYIKEKIK
jgi:carboxyl-terminal processing protease